MTIKLPWGLSPFEAYDVMHIEVLLTIYAERLVRKLVYQ
jgi:hypothetical protein